MKELITFFEEGHKYTFEKINADPSVNKDRDVKDHIGGFDFKDILTGEIITIFPNQFHGRISIVERDGDCVKLVKKRSKYAGGFVEFFRRARTETSTYAELGNRLSGQTFVCRKVWEHTEVLKGFNATTHKSSNLWVDANTSGFLSCWLGYDGEDPNIVVDPIL